MLHTVNTISRCSSQLLLNGLYFSLLILIEVIGRYCVNCAAEYQSSALKIRNQSYPLYFNYCLFQLLMGKEIVFIMRRRETCTCLQMGDLRLPSDVTYWNKRDNIKVTLLNASLFSIAYALFYRLVFHKVHTNRVALFTKTSSLKFPISSQFTPAGYNHNSLTYIAAV